MNRVVALFLCFCFLAPVALAQTDNSTFRVRVFGGTDTTPPSTPTLVSADAITTSQVDLAWSASTDNFTVSGYVLFRDGSPIATTTLTNYSDSGLTASTTYTYSVRAFDPALNYSSSSNALSATTFGVVVPPTPSEEDDSIESTSARVVLDTFYIDAKERSAVFSLTTKRPARFEIRWGRTNSYELGYTVNDIFTRSYETTLTELEPGTVYQYEVVGYTPYGTETVLERGQFKTKSQYDNLAPTNVKNFFGIGEGDDVRLSWENPIGTDISHIRIVRSHLSFPTHLQDGVVVYQGEGESFIDKEILSLYSPVYYTAFVVDASGNVSSGAITRVYAFEAGGIGVQPPIPTELENDEDSSGTASTSPLLPPGTRMPSLDEIFVRQGEKRASLLTDEIVLTQNGSFVISIPAYAIAKDLKTIIGSITDPSDSRRAYSFLLRINKDGSAYEAVVPAVAITGRSKLVIDIYNYETAVVATYQKTIFFKEKGLGNTVPIFPDRIIFFLKDHWLLLLVLISGFGLLSFWWKRHDTEDKA